MIRIVFTAPDPTRNTSWWRGMGPMIDLERAYPDEFSVICPTEISWETLRRNDLLWMMHAGRPDHGTLIEMARGQGCAVVVDWDDMIWDIPTGNWIRTKITPGELERAAEIIMRSDIVSVSTPELAAYLANHGCTVPSRVLRNTLPTKMPWPAQPPPTKTVLWRGGQTHDGDIAAVEDDVVRLAEEFPDWNWVWAGWDRWSMSSRIPRERWSYWDVQPLNTYHAEMAKLAPAIVMAPLVDSEFNRCKSRLAVLEAAIAGGTLVCPDFPNYAEAPGAMHYRHGVEGEGFYDVMKQAMSLNPEALRVKAGLGRIAIDHVDRTQHILPTLRETMYMACGRELPEVTEQRRLEKLYRNMAARSKPMPLIAHEEPTNGNANH